MSEATADAAAGKGGKSKAKLLIIAGIVLAVLLAGGGAAAFLLGKTGADEAAAADEGDEERAASQPKKKAKKAKAEHPPIFVQLDPFTVNLADTEADRFAQIQFVLEAADKKVDDEVKAQLPAVRNAILLLLSSKTSRELLTLEGKERLAAEVLAATAKRVGTDRVESVHFAQFIVQ
jgi:flagellar FliL protein